MVTTLEDVHIKLGNPAKETDAGPVYSYPWGTVEIVGVSSQDISTGKYKDRFRSKVKGGWLASAMKLVDDVQAPDARTVTIGLKEPYAPLLNLMSELWILSPKSPGWDDAITQPIGTT